MESLVLQDLQLLEYNPHITYSHFHLPVLLAKQSMFLYICRTCTGLGLGQCMFLEGLVKAIRCMGIVLYDSGQDILVCNTNMAYAHLLVASLHTQSICRFEFQDLGSLYNEY